MIAFAPSESLSSNSRSETLRKNLRCSVGDGGAWGVMVGMGETYLPAFALAIGLGEVTSGWVASLPMLAGGIVQTMSLRAIKLVGSYQRWVAISAAIQAIAFFPLMWFAFCGRISAPMLFFLASIYWAGGLAAGPAWNTWVGYLVPKTLRSRFFAFRSRISQFSTLSGFLAGGVILHFCREQEMVLIGFGCIFLIAGVARLLSVLLLGLHKTPPSASIAVEKKEVAESSEDVARGYRLVLFLATIQIAVQFSGPYFTPYLLKQLEVSYVSYVALISVAFIAKATSMSMWGYLARNRGPRWLLWTGAIAIVPISALWLVSDNFYWLVFTQVASGTAWAAYELGFFLMFFETLPPERRTRMLTTYNLANSAAWFTGSLLGGWCLSVWGATPSSYLSLYLISSIGRFCGLALLWNVDRPLLLTLRQAKLRLQSRVAPRPTLAVAKSVAVLPSRETVPVELTLDRPQVISNRNLFPAEAVAMTERVEFAAVSQ